MINSVYNYHVLQDLPLEYNTWLLFRQAVDIILLKFAFFLLHLSRLTKPAHFQRLCGVLYVRVYLLPSPRRSVFGNTYNEVQFC